MFEAYLVIILVMSLVTALAYKVDKVKAAKSKWRTKEKTLLGLSFFGGSLGGLFSLYVTRHKNKHWYFGVKNFGSFILHVVIGYLLFKM